MHIGLNYTAALRQGAGIGRYTKGLITTLASIDSQNQYTLIISKDSPQNQLFPLPQNFQLKVLPFSERHLTILWHRLYLPLYIDWWAGPFDLFHSPDFVLPPLQNTPGILTVHDLSFMRHPQGALPNLRQWLNKVVPHSVTKATHILADSDSTKQDLEILLKVPASKITVVGAGVDHRFSPVKDQTQLQTVRQKYKLPQNFVLGLGTLEPRKNFTGLIGAFNRVEAHLPDLHLVIAGGKGWLYDDIFAAAATSTATDRIHLIGYVADEDIPALYSLATIFAYPSHYEGFGIPVLEAMACGTPVITANNSSLPEVAGDAALLVSAEDTEALSKCIMQIYNNYSLRESFISAGFAQVTQYSWQQAAKKLLETYEKVAAL